MKMKIFGKSLSEYIRFQKIFLILILIVGLARLGLSLAGVPTSIVKFFSLTVVMLIGFVYYAVRVQTSGFGSYKQLLPLIVIQNILGEGIIILGIMIAIFTGKDNIFSQPEYSAGMDGKSWSHVAGHLLIGIILLSLVWWGVGSVLMYVTGKLSEKGKEDEARA